MLRYSGGDARKLLNILELVVEAEEKDEVVITDEKVVNRLQQNPLAYDKDGEMHYDIISAFIKSIRGSDPDAALYWLARMIEGGEDPLFIARRLVISAAEDIGLANPNALLLANTAFDVVQKIGWPEGRIPLAEATVYLATSPKSNSAYLGIDTPIGFTSQLEGNALLKREARIYDFCHRMGADHYINAIGGQQLYSFEEFRRHGIRLSFLSSQAAEAGKLSVLDAIMNHSRDALHAMLDQYTLIDG